MVTVSEKRRLERYRKTNKTICYKCKKPGTLRVMTGKIVGCGCKKKKGAY